MYHIYMPVDMVVMLSTNKYRRYYKKEQTNDKLLDKLLEKKELQVENSNSTCIELFKFW
jgi:hypothetical protein